MDEASDVLIASTIGDLSWLKRSLAAAGLGNTINDTLRNGEGLGPVHLAAKNCKLNVLDYLLTHCTVEIDMQAQPSGDTALHCALSKAASKTAVADVTRCVKMLLDKGANCNRQNSAGSSSLHCAAAGGYATVLNMLLSHGAKIHHQNDSGRTAYDLACLHGHYKCARILQALIWADNKDSCLKMEHNQTRLSQKNVVHDSQTEEASCNQFEQITQQETSHVDGSFKSKVPESKKLLHVTTTKINLHQADRNISQIGKPDKMYPYTNYPPVNLRQHNSASSSPNNSVDIRGGTNLRLVQSARTTRTSRPYSGKSLKSQSLSSTHHYSQGRRMPRRSKNTPTGDIHGSYESPTSKHCSLSHATRSKMSMNVINLEGVDLPLGNRHHESSGSEDSDNGGSSTSIDGLTFHDVGQVNDLQSLTVPSVSTDKPAISPAELLQLLRLASNDTNRKSLRRASSFSFRGSKERSDRGRRFSLGAIPEGEMVTHYFDEQPDKALDFDTEFLYNIMPFAFQGVQSPAGHANEVLSTASSIATSTTSQPLLRSESVPPQQGRLSQLSVVTVAWESEGQGNIVDDRPISPRTGQPSLPLSPTSLEPVLNPPTLYSTQPIRNGHAVKSSRQSNTKHEQQPHLLPRRIKSAPQKRTQLHRQVLKSTVFEFGKGLTNQ